MKGTEGQRIIYELRPSDRDYVIPKRTCSAFDGTGLDRALKAVYDGKGANIIIITGLLIYAIDIHHMMHLQEDLEYNSRRRGRCIYRRRAHVGSGIYEAYLWNRGKENL
jgi:hypothetical protein